MTKTRERTGTVTAAVSAHTKRTDDVRWPTSVAPPPKAMQAEVMETFGNVLSCRPPDMWRHPDVDAAAQYAMVCANLSRALKQLSAQGVMRENARGAMVQNPLVSLVATLQATASSLARRLGLGSPPAPKSVMENAARAFSETGQTYRPAAPGAAPPPGRNLVQELLDRHAAKQEDTH